MKKYLSVIIIVSALIGCNNDGTSSETVKDSVLEQVDSVSEAKVDSIENATDSAKERIENTFEKTDSANKAIADSTK
jgi:hypothetical protein